jgi:sterol desaturase/sphingolipid hydroxylase (fatty acid hydroxylase superfamily)
VRLHGSPAGGWARVFERFPPGRYALVGSIALIVRDWGRPQPGEAGLFPQSALTRFVYVGPRALIVIYGSLASVLFWRGVSEGVSPIRGMVIAAAGLACWTFIEYLLHRFVFHHTPRSPRQMFFGYLFHGVHHAFPEDRLRWTIPLVTSLPVAGVLAAASFLSFGAAGGPFIAGVLLGYLAYDLLHYAIHRGQMRSRLGNYLRKRHFAHHYGIPERNFGVSSPLWDRVFRTGK